MTPKKYLIKNPKRWVVSYYILSNPSSKQYLSSVRGNKILFTYDSELCKKYVTPIDASKDKDKVLKSLSIELDVILIKKEALI